MAYRSADGGGYGAGASVFHLDSAHPDTVVIPDADLLFHGVLHRAGPDLRLTGQDGRHHIIPGYFAGEKHPALVAPNGARLSADLVDLLAGSPAPGQYAQANAPLPPDAIGKVEKVVGHVEVIRNGTAVALNVGDAVYKSDIIQTGANSQCGVDFPDGTALNLVSNTRMALNDYSYDPNSTSNNAAFSIVQGAFGFVAGKVAHTGDMNIATPVATMGIRGTIGTAQQQADATWAFTVDDGVYLLLDVNGQILERVFRIGFHTLIHRENTGTYTVTTEQMTSAEQQLVQEIVRDVIQTLELFNNPNPNAPSQNPGSSTPPDQIEHFQLLLNENNGPPIVVNVTVLFYQGPGSAPGTNGGTNAPPNNQGGSGPPSSTFIWNGGSGNWDTPESWSTGSVPINTDDNILVQSGTLPYNNSSDNDTVNSLTVDPRAEFDLSQGTLNVLHGVTDNGTIFVAGDPPTLTISGPVTIGHSASLVAGVGGETDINNATVTNDGVIAARHGGTIDIEGGTVTNSDRIAAWGSDLGVASSVTIDVASLVNEPGGAIAATRGGVVTLSASDFILNDAGATISAGSGGALTLITNVSAVNEGTIAASNGGLVVFDFDGQAGSGGPYPDNGGNYNLIEANAYGTIDIAGGIPNYGSIYAFGASATVDFTPNCFGQEVQNFGFIASAEGGAINFEHVTVYNADTGSIGSNDGGIVTFEHARVENFGGVTGGPQLFGISAADGGTIVFDCSHIFNACGALIQAQDDSAIVFRDSHVDNAGATTLDGSGIVAFAGGSITFDDSEVCNTGLISAGYYGDGGEGGTVYVDHSTIDNAGGTIWAVNVESSVQLFDSTINGGTLTSAQGGYFEIDAGGCATTTLVGITLSAGSTIDIDPNARLDLECTTTLQDGAEIFAPAGFLDNGGTISVSCGDTASILVDEIVNCGTIAAYDGATLDLSSYIDNHGTIAARGTDSVIGLNSSVIFGGTLFISCGATVDVGGSGAFLSGVNVIDNGTLEVNGGFFALDPSSSICGSGDIVITGGGAAALYGALNSDLSVTFSGDGTLALSSTPVGTLTIAGFGYGDAIDLINLPFDPGNSSAILSGDTLTVTAGSSSKTVHLVGEPNGSVFTAVNDGTGVTMVLYGAEDEWIKTSGSKAWQGNGGANWSGGIPTATENAVVDKPGIYTITLAGGNETLNNLTISDVDATLAGFGTINSGIINAGTIEASGGTLTLDGNVLNGDDGPSLGILSALSGSTLKLEGSGIDNFGDIDVSGTLLIDAAGGILSLDSSSSNSFVTGTVDLSGGSITAAAGQTLANWGNTIEGYGHIGHGTGNLTLENFDGTIDANVSGQILTIDTGNGVFNAGTLEATSGGILQIDDPVANVGTIEATGGTINFTNSAVANGGTIEADPVASGTINLTGVEITGGELQIGSSGTINIDAPGARLSDVALTDNGALNVNSGLFVVREDSTVSGDGSINIAGGGVAVFYDALDSNLSVNFGGAGVLALDAAPHGCDPLVVNDFGAHNALNLLNVPFPDFYSTTVEVPTGGIVTLDGETLDFTNVTNSTLTLVSDGTGGTLVLDGAEDEWINPTGVRPWSGPNNAANWSTGSVPTATDNVVVDEAGSYTVTVSANKTFNSLTVSDAGAVVEAENSLTLTGGITNAGTIEISPAASGATLTLDGDVLNAGTLSATNGNALQLETNVVENVGNVAISGTLSIDAPGGVLDLDSGNGAGTVTLTGGTIAAAAAGQTLLNLGNTISGYGEIGADGDGNLTLDNGIGTIDANVNGLSLTLDTGNTVVNAGLLEATNGGILDIQDGTVDNTGTVLIDGISSLLIDGNNPSFVGNTIIANSVSLTGGGEVSLQSGTITENADNGLVTSSGAILALDNVDNTISGSGTIGSGDGHLQLTNAGTIDANFNGAQLTIHTDDDSSGNSTNAVINTGTLEATNGGQLAVLDPVNNTGGTIDVTSSGFVDFFLNVAGGSATINDGTLLFGWSSDVNVAFAGSYGALEINGTQTFGGAICGFSVAYSIDVQGVSPLGQPQPVWTQNGASGTLSIDCGAQALTLQGTYTSDDFSAIGDGNGGTLVVFGDEWTNAAGGTFSDNSNWTHDLTGSTNAVIDLNGTYTINTSGSVAANSLVIGDHGAALTGSGTLQIGTIDNNGTIAAAAGQSLEIAGNVNGPGQLEIGGGATLTLDGAGDNTVAFEGGTGALILDQPGNFTGQIENFTGTAPDATHSDVIDLAGINYNSGSFTENYNSTTGVLTVSDGTDSATLTFDNFNGTFKFASDGSGGTDIYDPPATTSSAPSASINNDSFSFHHHDGAGAGGGDSDIAGHTPGLGQWTAAEIQQWLGSHDESGAAPGDFAHHNDAAAAHWHAATQSAFHLH